VRIPFKKKTYFYGFWFLYIKTEKYKFYYSFFNISQNINKEFFLSEGKEEKYRIPFWLREGRSIT
jgi:hypothetical protein